jgi:hypothetical protein
MVRSAIDVGDLDAVHAEVLGQLSGGRERLGRRPGDRRTGSGEVGTGERHGHQWVDREALVGRQWSQPDRAGGVTHETAEVTGTDRRRSGADLCIGDGEEHDVVLVTVAVRAVEPSPEGAVPVGQRCGECAAHPPVAHDRPVRRRTWFAHGRLRRSLDGDGFGVVRVTTSPVVRSRLPACSPASTSTRPRRILPARLVC